MAGFTNIKENGLEALIPSFKKWLSDLVFHLTYNKAGIPYENPRREHNAIVYEFPSQGLPLVAENLAQ